MSSFFSSSTRDSESPGCGTQCLCLTEQKLQPWRGDILNREFNGKAKIVTIVDELVFGHRAPFTLPTREHKNNPFGELPSSPTTPHAPLQTVWRNCQSKYTTMWPKLGSWDSPTKILPLQWGKVGWQSRGTIQLKVIKQATLISREAN